MKKQPSSGQRRRSRENGRSVKVISYALIIAVLAQFCYIAHFLSWTTVTTVTTGGSDADADADAEDEIDIISSHISSNGGINHKRYDKVVIVSKIHGTYSEVKRLKKMFCFCNAAYNQYVNYDVVIFHTRPLKQQWVEELHEAFAPTNLTIARDGPTLEEHIASMTNEEVAFLHERCGVKPGENITWYHHCKDGKSGLANVAYSWQSEFRAYHIYRHQALANYKYMIWFDSDANCIDPWKEDPIKVMIENDLVLLMYAFNNGKTKNPIVRPKMKEVYGREICKIDYNGQHLVGLDCDGPDDRTWLDQIHGFHHITNLDFYRNETQQRFLKLLVGDYKFSRQWDDQIGVTLPAVLGAPTKAWRHRDHGLNMTMFHKEKIVLNHGQRRVKTPKSDFRKYWLDDGGEEKMMTGGEKCTKHLLK